MLWPFFSMPRYHVECCVMLFYAALCRVACYVVQALCIMLCHEVCVCVS